MSRPFRAITSVIPSLTTRRQTLQVCTREAGNPVILSKNQSQPPHRERFSAKPSATHAPAKQDIRVIRS
jgi:hypothetical protein